MAVRLPLEADEVQKGAGGVLRLWVSPSPRRLADPAEASVEGGVEEAEAATSGRRAGARLRSISGEAAFYGRY